MMTAEPLVSGDWLAAHINDPGIVVADCRWNLEGPTPLEIYIEGHIAGSVLVDLERDLSSPPGKDGGHPLPKPADFAAAMRRIGISDDSYVIAYGHNGSSAAARLWWMLDSLGVRCSVLDGGFAAWNGPVTDGPPPPVAPVSFSEKPFPKSRFATADDVTLRAGDVALIDARARNRFDGAPGGDYPRYGHIPGAVHAFAFDNYSSTREPRYYLDKGKLASLYKAVNLASPDQPVIAYCGSGVSACTTLLALRLLGFRDLRLYTGSFSEWGADVSRPIEI